MSEQPNLASQLTAATVFLQGAELTRQARCTVSAGKNTLVLTQLPSSVYAASLTTSVSENVHLISSGFRINHRDMGSDIPRLSELSEQLRALTRKLKQLEAQRDVCDAEEELLLAHRQIGGREGLRLPELKGIHEYFADSLLDLKLKRLRLDDELTECRQEITRLQNELGDYQQGRYREVGEIVVELSSELEQEAEITVSYYIAEASWQPSYEIRVADSTSPARLIAKGEIVQTSGEDWLDIPLVLSSGSPNHGGQQPTLQPWYLDLSSSSRPQPSLVSTFFSKIGLENADEMEIELLEDDAPPGTSENGIRTVPRRTARAAVPQAQMRQEQTSIEFILPAPTSVLSGEAGRSVDIFDMSMNATYQYYCVRKLDMDVFLLAEIAGWEKLNLLAGDVAIFLGNSFIGHTYLDPRQAESKLEISLGRDKGIIVTRTRGRDFQSKTLFGNTLKASREWILTARNSKDKPIQLRLLDQVPVSVNDRINVEVQEISGAEHDAESGQLCWIIDLSPGETAKRTLRYEVSYPKEGSIRLE